ncbi:shK domain-like domain-containing protein [Ditylenchus destructor]|uniref:ShK domain-like domain-containing protein n=1 Tax=Ditylenchus destructor TaxID=166010 RepID=A0AAD4R4W6_9BILA|nr:shK domain-like domain-containing protein [Ditylenchus destructor]
MMLAFYNFVSDSQGLCADKIMPGHPGDCKMNKDKCNEAMWKDLMTDQCPMTCGICSDDIKLKMIVMAKKFCADGVGKNGISDCPKHVERCTDPLWNETMRLTCPKTCGFCNEEMADQRSQENLELIESDTELSPIIPYINGWSEDELFDYNRTNGRFPPVTEYLPKSYIRRHLSMFDDGAAFFITEQSLEKFGRELIGRPDNTQFVIPVDYMDDLLYEANGNISVVEDELGIPAGLWVGQNMRRIDVPRPRLLHLRQDRGYLPTGIPEAVIDRVPIGMYIESEVDTIPKRTRRNMPHFQPGYNHISLDYFKSTILNSFDVAVGA